MKNISLILVSIFSIFLIVSCVTEAEEIDRQYQILNMSKVDVMIKFYNTYKNESFEITLSNNETYLPDILTYRSGNAQLSDQNSYYPSGAYQDSDSLVLIFNNEKLITNYYEAETAFKYLFSEPINRNIFRHGNYVQIQKEVFQFTITEQDYENAEECNGNCE